MKQKSPLTVSMPRLSRSFVSLLYICAIHKKSELRSYAILQIHLFLSTRSCRHEHCIKHTESWKTNENVRGECIMRKIRIAFWICTILFSLGMLFPTISAVLGEKETVKFITEHFGYPAYFVFYSGIVKVLGIAAILIPGYPRVKEWAYAGLAFDLISVVYSSIAVGDSIIAGWPMLIYFLLLTGSYVCYHKMNASVSTAATDTMSPKLQ